MITNLTHKIYCLRIPCLGNLYSIHFSMERYLTDLWFDYELLLFTNEQFHFEPKCDAYSFDFMTWVKGAPGALSDNC